MEKRILLYGPGGKDAQIAARVLSADGIETEHCSDVEEMLAQLQDGAGAVLTIEEALDDSAFLPLERFIRNQPTWSDLPLIVLARHGSQSPTLDKAVNALGNVMVLERPVRTTTLLSTVRSALRGRIRQYQVREAEQRKDEFLAALGHELRNPLAPIRTSMHILKRMYPAAAAVTQVREVVERQVTYLTRLVDDLLDVARITSGKVELQREQIVLSDMISHALEICAPLLNAGGHRIDVSQPAHEIQLEADPVRLVQSLTNILANAVKYSMHPSTISLVAEVESKTLVVRIRDQGIGMTPETLAHIFEMFRQGEQVQSHAPGGLGIGLSLARQFTEMHGGTIEANSAGLGKGSEFILTLPVVIPDQQQSAFASSVRHIESEMMSARNRQVLVVDDNRDGADMLQRLFEADGFSVLTAYDGSEAVEAVKKSRPHIVVMDIGMPGMDGYEAVRQIRRQPGGGDILMIALTGWGQEDARRLAAEAGFDHHLVKPVDFDVLKNFLEDAHR